MDSKKVVITAVVGLGIMAVAGIAQTPGPTPPQSARIVQAPVPMGDQAPASPATSTPAIVQNMSNLANQQGTTGAAPTGTPGMGSMTPGVRLNYAMVGSVLYLFATNPSGVTETLVCGQGQQDAGHPVTLNGWKLQPAMPGSADQNPGTSDGFVAQPGGAAQMTCAVSDSSPPPTK